MSNRKDIAREKRIAEKSAKIAKAYRMWKTGSIAYCELIVIIADTIGKTKDYSEKCSLSAMLDVNCKEFKK